MPALQTIPYLRQKAVAYAHTWAYRRNPKYYDFENIGGDCTNFASQCLYAGCGVMNPTPTYGWYYYSLNNRAPAWTSVEYLYRFLTQNEGVGPFASPVSMDEVQPGDLVQLKFAGKEVFGHTPVIVSVGENPTYNSILVAAHSYDRDNWPLSNYRSVAEYRFLHIEGARIFA